MKALTLIRPWPYAIFRLGKDVENRGWKPPKSVIGQRIAIHAGAKWDYHATEWIYKTTGDRSISRQYLSPRGIVGTVRVVSCFPCLPDEPDAHNRWASGPWCWLLAGPFELLEPIPCKGTLGLWEVPEEIARRIER